MASFLSSVFWFLVLVVAVLGAIAWTSYNKLQSKAQAIKEQQSNVQIAVSKKLSLLNQLIDVVRNFQESEQFTHIKISQDSSNASLLSAYQQSGMLLTSLQGTAQKFPELRASEQYHRLIDSIQHCETDIQARRQAYNATVRDYNSICLSIPTVFVSRFMGFSSAPYLEFDISGTCDVTPKEFRTDDGERLQQLLSGAGERVMNASKVIASQAGEAGRQLANAVKEKVDSHHEPLYFFLSPGGVPEGPLTLAKIREAIANRPDADAIKIAQQGSHEWQPLPPT